MAKVEIENGSKVLMSELQIGDKVQTGIGFILQINIEVICMSKNTC